MKHKTLSKMEGIDDPAEAMTDARKPRQKTLGVSCHELRGCGCGKPCRCLQPQRGLSQPARQVQSWWSVAVEIIRNTNLPSCECQGVP